MFSPIKCLLYPLGALADGLGMVRNRDRYRVIWLFLIFFVWFLPRVYQVHINDPIVYKAGNNLGSRVGISFFETADTPSYVEFAHRIQAGHPLIHAERGPVFPLFMATSQFLWGSESHFYLVFSIMIMTLLAGYALFYLGRHCGLPPLFSLIATLLYVGNYHTISHELTVLTDVFAANLLIFAALVYVKCRRRAGFSALFFPFLSYIILVFTKPLFLFSLPLFFLKFTYLKNLKQLRQWSTTTLLPLTVYALTAIMLVNYYSYRNFKLFGYYGLSNIKPRHLMTKVIKYKAYEHLPKELDTPRIRDFLKNRTESWAEAPRELNDLLYAEKIVANDNDVEALMTRVIGLNRTVFVGAFLKEIFTCLAKTNDYLVMADMQKVTFWGLEPAFDFINLTYVILSKQMIWLFSLFCLMLAGLFIHRSHLLGAKLTALDDLIALDILFVFAMCLFVFLFSVLGSFDSFARLKIPGEPLFYLLAAWSVFTPLKILAIALKRVYMHIASHINAPVSLNHVTIT